MNNFTNFKVYKDGQILVTEIFRLTRKFSKEFNFLSDQINRSALSIVLNIAEGSGKNSDKDFNRYVKNALGSATELSAAIETAHNLELLTKEELEKTELAINSIIKQLGGFSKYLSKNISD